MAEPKRVESREFEIHEITVKNRLRPVSDAGVEAVLASLQDLGSIVSPIWLRKTKQGYVLLDGAHRMAAAQKHGLTSIRGIAYQCTDKQARMMEIDGNLAGAELDALDTAVFLAERKRIYEEIHPQTKQGAAGAAARWDATDTMSVASFVNSTATKFGLSERHVRRLISSGTVLSKDQVRWLRSAPKPVTLSDLQTIAKVGDDHERSQICIALTNGDAKSASDAARQYAAKQGETPAGKDPVDEAFKALLTAWKRAPKAARRRFVADAHDELSDLLSDEMAGREK